MKNQEIKNLYAFTLGREWKLSLAELIALFGEQGYEGNTEEIALFFIENKTPQELGLMFRTIGGSIRIIEILDETDERRFPTDVIEYIKDSAKINNSEMGKKTNFALGAYGIEYRTSDIGLRIKKTLVEEGMSVRLVNKENSNINAAAFKNEKLAKSQNEYNIITLGKIIYLGRTLACQDIDAYSHRDTAKSRDMIVGMMPPKLTQIMLNLALSDKHQRVYDPFCGLGTTLIEAANMGITKLTGSDMSRDMVRTTTMNIEAFVSEERVWQEKILALGGKPNKDFSNMETQIFELDATKIFRHFEGKKLDNTVIVSEGYLGAIMQRESITTDRVKSERMSLMRMYDSFFHGLKNLGFRGNIVMTFPFWDIRGTHSYFTEIYEVLEESGFEVIPLLPKNMTTLLTKKGSLLYKRPNQNVGREVIKIRLKK